MGKEQEKKEKTEKVKKESTVVTRESICATCALFSFLAFLMLCTRTLIFGGVGKAVHIFLTGAFGYLAYPLLLCAMYLSVTGLIGKSFVRNKALGVWVGITLSLLALIVHTAVTYSWSLNGYLKACYRAGEAFPKATPAGFLGGLITFLFASFLTQIGALVLFCSATLFAGYLCYVSWAKGKGGARVKHEKVKKDRVEEKIAAETAYADATAPKQATGAPLFRQRPGVSLDDSVTAQQPAIESAPLIPPSEARQYGYDNRTSLFGGSPADDFRRNLLFDPTAKVNQRPSVVPSAEPTVQSSYTPSYTEAYEKEIGKAEERPAKIVNDYSQEYYGAAPTPEVNDFLPASPVQPTEFLREEPVEVERSVESFTPSPVEWEEPVEEPAQTPYKRHEYMDIFSPSNPNVFGNDEEEARFGREFADRALERSDVFDEVRSERGDKDGMKLLDDEDDPYTLRSDFSDREIVEERGREESFDRGIGFDEPSLRGRESVEETPVRAESVKPVEPPKPEPPKPRVIRPYVRPRLDDFDCRDIELTSNEEEVRQTKEDIIATLEEFKITGASIASVTFGPTVTRYNVTIPRSISPKKVVALDQSIAINLHSNGVNIYPNYEDGVVSIEVPNRERQFVQLGCMLTGDSFVNAKSSSIMYAMGKDVANRKVYGDITKMIHLLVAGSSGSGKSVYLGSLIVSLIYKYSPEELRLILIDPKKTEFVLYNNLPHLMINEIITDAGKAVQSLNWAIG